MALQLPPRFDARIARNEPLAEHTSWRVGGPADIFFKPESADDLAGFLRMLDAQTNVYFIGLGSNLLVRDGGVRGAVIATHGAFGEIKQLAPTEVWLSSGVACAKVAKQCIKWGLGPAEFFAGIPGTVGGALAMNAGAFGGETWPHVVEVETINRAGEIRRRPASDYQVSYRHVVGPRNEWFLGAHFHFELRPGVSHDDVRVLLARRKESQPIGELSCGSVFTNPPGDHAARLIEASGLKSYRIGGARVSEKHANFIINDGTASAADIERLIEFVRDTVQAEQGVSLNTEVRMIGVT
ncbi:MAG: UDP-N-acetylmuramate dehydrogenase [Candidatus Obscuribacterales bacterium]|nr:UDP-N-acetylmuramate dehydrogenase [Steroidobacteraceae bacterium]